MCVLRYRMVQHEPGAFPSVPFQVSKSLSPGPPMPGELHTIGR